MITAEKCGLKDSPTIVKKVFAPTPRAQKADLIEAAGRCADRGDLESGIHVDGLLKDRRTYQALDPASLDANFETSSATIASVNFSA